MSAGASWVSGLVEVPTSLSGPLIPRRGAFVLSGNSVFPFLQPLGPAVRFGGSAEPDAFSFWSEGSFGWDLWRGVSPSRQGSLQPRPRSLLSEL